MSEKLIASDDIATAARVLRALNHPLRRKMLLLINEDKRMCVTDIYEELKLDQSICSSHLAILRKEGIVKRVIEGKWSYYEIIPERLEKINQLAGELCKK